MYSVAQTNDLRKIPIKLGSEASVQHSKKNQLPDRRKSVKPITNESLWISKVSETDSDLYDKRRNRQARDIS